MLIDENNVETLTDENNPSILTNENDTTTTTDKNDAAMPIDDTNTDENEVNEQLLGFSRSQTLSFFSFANCLTNPLPSNAIKSYTLSLFSPQTLNFSF